MHTIRKKSALYHGAVRKHSSPLWVAVMALFLTLVSSALAQTNAVLSCGYNGFGALGDSTTTDRSLLTPAYYISGIKAVACGDYHTLALDSTGTVWAWGDN